MGLPFPRADSSVYGPLGEVDGEFASTQGAIDNTTSAGSSLIRQPRPDRDPPGPGRPLHRNALSPAGSPELYSYGPIVGRPPM